MAPAWNALSMISFEPGLLLLESLGAVPLCPRSLRSTGIRDQLRHQQCSCRIDHSSCHPSTHLLTPFEMHEIPAWYHGQIRVSIQNRTDFVQRAESMQANIGVRSTVLTHHGNARNKLRVMLSSLGPGDRMIDVLLLENPGQRLGSPVGDYAASSMVRFYCSILFKMF